MAWGGNTEIQTLLYQFCFFTDVTNGKANANCNSSMTICIICIRRVLKSHKVKVLELVPEHLQHRSEVLLLGEVEVITYSIIHSTWDFKKQVGHHSGQLHWALGALCWIQTHTRQIFSFLAWPWVSLSWTSGAIQLINFYVINL